MKENSKVLIIGAGLMAIEYAKVLKELGRDYAVITRGTQKAKEMEDVTGCKTLAGGLTAYLERSGELPPFIINTVGIEALSKTTAELILAGAKNILLEKPGVAYANEIDGLAKLAENNRTNIVLAYNRRFYASVKAAREIIQKDGGVTSFNFEFTEWSHTIAKLASSKTKAELHNWFLGNSTHVIDLAFFLGGEPKEISCYVSGQNRVEWHPTSSNYSGAGISSKGALFAYHANWKAPGRFSLEVLTDHHRLVFRPLEKLQIQAIGSVAINPAEGVDYTLDEKFKPGLYLQTQAFLDQQLTDFCSLSEQNTKMKLYRKMSGYS